MSAGTLQGAIADVFAGIRPPRPPIERTRYGVMLIDAIVGAGMPSIEYAINAEKCGYATFTGNQHNEDWSWTRSRLEAETDDELLAIYVNIKENQR